MKSIILKRRDQQNHLMDLNFNQQKGRISDHMYPFYRVFDERGQQYCDCSHEEYAIRTVELHAEHQNETFTYRRIDAPKPLPPHIVDVNAEYEAELPGQQGLPSANKLNPQQAQERLHQDIRKELEKSKLHQIEQ